MARGTVPLKSSLLTCMTTAFSALNNSHPKWRKQRSGSIAPSRFYSPKEEKKLPNWGKLASDSLKTSLRPRSKLLNATPESRSRLKKSIGIYPHTTRACSAQRKPNKLPRISSKFQTPNSWTCTQSKPWISCEWMTFLKRSSQSPKTTMIRLTTSYARSPTILLSSVAWQGKTLAGIRNRRAKRFKTWSHHTTRILWLLKAIVALVQLTPTATQLSSPLEVPVLAIVAN